MRVRIRVPAAWLTLPPGYVALRLLLLVLVATFFVGSLVALARAGAVGWVFDVIGECWGTVRDWLGLP